MLEYLSFITPVVIVEIFAAVIALVTLKKYNNLFGFPERIIVFYLCFTCFTELLGMYPQYIYKEGLETSGFFQDHPGMLRAFWWYNIYSIVAAVCFGLYYRAMIVSKVWRQIIAVALGVFVLSAIMNLAISDVYFEEFSMYTDFSSVILLVFIISMYYYELLTSDRILTLSRSFGFLISIAVLLFYIIITPLFLLSSNFMPSEPIFMSFYTSLLNVANAIFYGMFIFSYLWCYWFNKSLKKK